ncbi:uncharacterized protein LY89DRAFT_782172 [Mollisia scopiformis]|uniref:Uncharacterized protein n=1 Tax=Mollisia scopiformis TaxID=149040 RepID=A0A194X9U1_MOLSC|nr:uncharacterized protein LY89DRAFT_782172 [Mollisia scopiformis]KUJ16933.1 hypothetical protein LY89DRAFT_782172 [Mollisia scopiformis]
MEAFFDKLQAEQKKSGVRQFAHALKSGDKEDQELAGIVSRLSNARQELSLRVSVVNVGLTGNVNDGFQVAQQVLIETNENVRKVLGIQLMLAERLQERQLINTSQEMIQLDGPDVVALGLYPDTSNDSQHADVDDQNLNWQRNETGDAPRLFAGNMGLEDSNSADSVKGTVKDSKFGKDSRFMFGHVGGQSSQSFNENFWKSKE